MNEKIHIQIAASVDFDAIQNPNDHGAATAWVEVLDRSLKAMADVAGCKSTNEGGVKTNHGTASVDVHQYVAVSTLECFIDLAVKRLKEIGVRWPKAISIREGGELNA